MKKFLFFLMVFSSFGAHSQQHALYSQYIFNLFIVNPAYAGNREALSINAGYRAQWVGFDGSPRTQNFSAHGPIRAKNMALGLQFQNDVIGARRATSLAGTYSYSIRLNRKKKLSFGLQGSMLNYMIDWDKLSYGDSNEPIAYSIEPNRWIPNFDFGVMYSTAKGYLGFSAYNISNPNLSEQPESDARLSTHLQLMGGKVYELNRNFALKPGFFVRYAVDGPMQVDASLSALFANSVWLTTTYRHGFGMVGTAQVFISEKFHFGYSYDWTLNNLAAYQSGSHEIFIGCDLSILPAADRKPRYY